MQFFLRWCGVKMKHYKPRFGDRFCGWVDVIALPHSISKEIKEYCIEEYDDYNVKFTTFNIYFRNEGDALHFKMVWA